MPHSSIVVKSCLVAFCGIVLATVVAAESPGEKEELQKELTTLASDQFEGRGIGTHGIDLAADYIRDRFAEAGLNVTSAGGDAFQEFEVLDKTELGSPNALALIGPEGARHAGVIDADFRTCSFSGSAHVTAPIVFAGYGIESQEPAYDDFANLEVRGKAVIILRRTPQQGNPHGLFSSPHGAGRVADLSTKISNAYRRGAAAVLLVNDAYTGRTEAAQLQSQLEKAQSRVADAAEALPQELSNVTADAYRKLSDATKHLREVREQLTTNDADPLMEFGYGPTRNGDAIPVFQIRRTLADGALKAGLGKTLDELEQLIDDSGKPASAEAPGWTLDAEANVISRMAPVKNVIGVLEGHGPLASETVIVGAHYDHLGYGGEGSLSPGSHEIHNGADDNASGAVALIAAARHFGAQKERVGRRILFIAFTGEERGLLGSAEYVREPIIPLEECVAMINLDMVGRLTDDKLTVFGAETAPQWNAWLDAAAQKLSLNLIKKPEGFGPSDHSSFYAKQIPVLHLFTGVHSEYHRPTDDVDKINFDGLERVAEFAETLIADSATSPQRPTYAKVAGQAQLERGGSRPYVGTIPDFGTNEKGYAIQGVAPDSPADKGGIRGGDVIIRFGGQDIGSLDDYDLALRTFMPGQEVDVVVLRSGQEVSLKVTLAKPR